MLTQRGLMAGLVLFVVALAIFLMTSKPPQPSASEASAQEAAAQEDVAAPDFSMKLQPGAQPTKLSDLKGNVVLLDFWATWCGPCRMSIPELEAIYKKYQAQGVKVVGIACDDPPTQKNIPLAREAMGITYPIVLATDMPDVAQQYNAGSLPTLCVIDKKGNIRKVEQGYNPNTGLSEVDELVQSLVKE